MLKKILLMGLLIGFVSACSSSSNSSSTSNADTVKVVAVGGSFSNPLGLIYNIKGDSTLTTEKAKDAAGSQITTNQDSIVRSYKDKIYVFSRDSNSAVLVLDNSGENKDPIANYSLSIEDPDGEIDIDGGSNGPNPYDIAFSSESEAYICFYNSNYILKLNPLTGERLAAIDVSFMKTITGVTASDASAPNIVDVELINGKLYILAQRLNAFFSPLESVMAIYNISTSTFVDTNTDTEEIDGIILSGKNPSDMLYLSSSGKIYIAHGGAINYASDFLTIESTDAGSTGIEEVVVSTNTTNGIIIPGTAFSETTDGFSVSKLLYDDSNKKMYAVFGAFDFTSNIKEVNVSNASVVSSPLLTANSAAFGDTTIDSNGYIYQINRSSSAPSIDVYNPETKALIKSITTELPMQSITVVK